MQFGNSDIVTLSILMAGMSLIPLIVVTTTSFLKISLVLLTTRNALGVQQVPPTIALYGIALAISAFVMAPAFQEIALKILDLKNTMSENSSATIFEHGRDIFLPLKNFMLKHTSIEHRDAFLTTAKQVWPKFYATETTSSDVMILIPAFVVSEMQRGFEISFLIYIPFVVIDLLISNLLMALGMQQVSPQTITVPLKILLFVMVDGWSRLLNALALSYV